MASVMSRSYSLGTFSGYRRAVSLQDERVCGVKEGKDTCDSVLRRHECAEMSNTFLDDGLCVKSVQH